MANNSWKSRNSLFPHQRLLSLKHVSSIFSIKAKLQVSQSEQLRKTSPTARSSSRTKLPFSSAEAADLEVLLRVPTVVLPLLQISHQTVLLTPLSKRRHLTIKLPCTVYLVTAILFISTLNSRNSHLQIYLTRE